MLPAALLAGGAVLPAALLAGGAVLPAVLFVGRYAPSHRLPGGHVIRPAGSERLLNGL